MSHDGKKKLVVVDASLDPDDPNARWDSLVNEFTRLLGVEIGEEKAKFAEADFSTSTETSKVSCRVGLMDAMSSYFEYVVVCGCGIPSITLRGTRSDWQRIRERVEELNQYGLEWWVKELIPVLDKFVDAFDGKVDVAFWESATNLFSGSGYCEPVSGWIQVFYPYLTKGVARGWGASDEKGGYIRNEYLGAWRDAYQQPRASLDATGMMIRSGRGGGVKLKNIPSSVSCVDFLCKDVRKPDPIPMQFVAGLTHIAIDKNGIIEPKFGWGVITTKKQ